MASFDKAIELVLEHEGGYVNNPLDPGGETKYGISKRAYPFEDIAGLTLERAKEIYKRDYWKYDAVLDQRVANKLLDMAVNMGASQAHKIVQKALGITADGVFGPATLKAVNDAMPKTLLDEICARLCEFYCTIVLNSPEKKVFLLGWLRRGVKAA